ncbi:MAG TPA: peroxiredoxin [Bryobacteraceae bacterium]|nr:peroxiredoxin [Bryobacteraceae bacterium]
MFSWLFSEPLPVGGDAPDFALPDQDGEVVSLADLRGKNVVLVFYPADETMVCTKQLCEFRDSWAAAQAREAMVFGVNPAGAAKHAAFRSHHRFPFPLLVDSGQHVAGRYHANGLIVKRTVYLIGKSGKIRYARRGKPDPKEVLAAAE